MEQNEWRAFLGHVPSREPGRVEAGSESFQLCAPGTHAASA
jgi:hypothetical protein